MKLIKFKSERGAVEFIESSYVFPLLMIFILSISLITINYVNEFYRREILYSRGLKILDENRKVDKKEDFKGDFFNEDESIYRVLNENTKSTFSYDDKFFMRELSILNSGKKIKNYRVRLVHYPNYTRKIDTIADAFNHLSKEKIGSFSLEKYMKKIEQGYIKFKGKIIK